MTQPVKAEKPRRNRFSPEFKWRLVQQTLLPGACVAQIARENGINDNLLFNWRHLWRNGGLQPPGEHETSLLPVTLTPEPDNKIPDPVQVEQINTPTDSLCCELVLPAGTLRLKGELTPALLQSLIRENEREQPLMISLPAGSRIWLVAVSPTCEMVLTAWHQKFRTS
ncbi:putative transposase subunit [Escherichia coli]|nr:putative transposase subunit [Escherichia coli]